MLAHEPPCTGRPTDRQAPGHGFVLAHEPAYMDERLYKVVAPAYTKTYNPGVR